MPQKKQQKLDRCPECGCAIKSKNLEKHILIVHKIGSQGQGGEVRPSKAEERKKLEMEQKKMKMNIVFSVILISLVVVVLYYWWGPGSDDNNPYTYEDSEESPTDPDSGDVRIPIADITTNAKFYTYNSNGVTIRYFVLKSSDGVVRAAFDTCDVCYEAKKGYRQEGDDMVCNNCDQRFPSEKINVEKGGCNPAPLTRTVEGDELVIKTSDIEAGSWYFE